MSTHRQYVILNVMAPLTSLMTVVMPMKEALVNMQNYTSHMNIHCLQMFSNLQVGNSRTAQTSHATRHCTEWQVHRAVHGSPDQAENRLDQVFNPANRPF